ncbi:hypothetical protein [Mycolicibacterium obuense]|uniref:Uncharacterized protein n=1 Tax=Mycolicibacterium obuense TaxID=1807 RepID=A0A0M2JUZ2_9MYCO|nr:hypothetical protein [Mycolicibacterium obuense]KKE98395.1 hypothetical protein WN67_29515 [Mycolicibacterium obuense]
MGITRHATRIHLSTGITPAGMPEWVVAYTVIEYSRESRFVTHHAAEAAARQLVTNLLRDRLPGFSIEDVYLEDLG